jgi:hypothetical protein
MRHPASSEIISGPAGLRATTNFGGALRSDIIHCAEEKRDRPVTDSKSSVEATKQAAELITWIVAQTHWTIHETPPIRLIPYAELAEKYGEKPTDFHVEALYSEQDRTVYLHDGWRADDLRDRSMLLHELVHHLQYLNHVKVTCESEYEFQAFKLQAKWLSEQGLEYPLDLMDIDPFVLLMLGHCDEMCN